MKIAITADIHLRSKQDYPERFNAFVNILKQTQKTGINHLIIAGDLFDIESQNYSEFDELCKKFTEIKFLIIPGNHDPAITSKQFTSNNIEIFEEPTILNMGDPPITFLLLPFMINKSMGEIMAQYKIQPGEDWILIGHGDYITGLQEPNPYEPGIYMPLTGKDIEFFNPNQVILGHIHKRMNIGKVHYVGSPCGLDINETGRRYFLTIDTQSLEIKAREVITDCIYFNATLTCLPLVNEFEYLTGALKELIESWKLDDNERSKARIRLKVRGYTTNKKQLDSLVKKELKGFRFYKDESIDLTELFDFDDPEKIEIVEEVKNKIDNINLGDLEKTVNREDLLEQALHIVLSS